MGLLIGTLNYRIVGSVSLILLKLSHSEVMPQGNDFKMDTRILEVIQGEAPKTLG